MSQIEKDRDSFIVPSEQYSSSRFIKPQSRPYIKPPMKDIFPTKSRSLSTSCGIPSCMPSDKQFSKKDDDSPGRLIPPTCPLCTKRPGKEDHLIRAQNSADKNHPREYFLAHYEQGQPSTTSLNLGKIELLEIDLAPVNLPTLQPFPITFPLDVDSDGKNLRLAVSQLVGKNQNIQLMVRTTMKKSILKEAMADVMKEVQIGNTSFTFELNGEGIPIHSISEIFLQFSPFVLHEGLGQFKEGDSEGWLHYGVLGARSAGSSIVTGVFYGEVNKLPFSTRPLCLWRFCVKICHDREHFENFLYRSTTPFTSHRYHLRDTDTAALNYFQEEWE